MAHIKTAIGKDLKGTVRIRAVLFKINYDSYGINISTYYEDGYYNAGNGREIKDIEDLTSALDLFEDVCKTLKLKEVE